MNRPVHNSFEEYVAAHPTGERYRDWLGNTGSEGCVFLPTIEPQDCSLDGMYLWAYVGNYGLHYKGKKWFVHVNNGDDSCRKKLFDNKHDADLALEELKLLAPFTLTDLLSFGYEHD